MNKVNNQNCYQKLGIDKNVTEKEIKDAYTRMAEIFCPDKIKETKGREANHLETQAWHEILDAYNEALKEVDNRKQKGTNGDKQQNKSGVNNINLDDFVKKS